MWQCFFFILFHSGKNHVQDIAAQNYIFLSLASLQSVLQTTELSTFLFQISHNKSQGNETDWVNLSSQFLYFVVLLFDTFQS